MNLNLMDPKVIALAVAVILIIAVLALLYVRKRRSTTADLRKKFGPEYDRAVRVHGTERKAEAKLEDREKRVEKLNLRDLDAMERDRFTKLVIPLAVHGRGSERKLPGVAQAARHRGTPGARMHFYRDRKSTRLNSSHLGIS